MISKNDIGDLLDTIPKKDPFSNFVISVRNVRLLKTSDKSDKSDNLTNLTFSYNDFFEKDTQQNKIKFALYCLSLENDTFNGLTQKEMAKVSGVDNLKNMGSIVQRMKVAGDITLSDKPSDKPSDKNENHYILTENAENDFVELVQILYDEKLEQFQKDQQKIEYAEKLEQSIFSLKEHLGKRDSNVWEVEEDNLILDFQKLSEINSTLANILLDEPEKTISLLESNLNEEGIFKNKYVRIKNLPESSQNEIKKTNTSHLDKLYYYDIEVVASTQICPATTSVKFECPSCGAIISIIQEVRGKIKEPSRCSCGRRGGFYELSRDRFDYRAILGQDNPESFDDSTTQRNKRLHLIGNIANIDEQYIQASSKLGVVGVPIIKETSQGEEIDINVNWLEPKDQLLVLKFSQEEIKQFEEFSKQNPLTKIKKEIFDLSVSGYDEVKKGLIIQQVGGNPKKLNNGTYKRGDIQIILIGDPGTSKSILTSNAKKLSPRCAVADSNRGTSAGLTGTFEFNQQLGQKVRMPGLFDKAKGGLLVWEELNEADSSVQGTLKTPLESSEYSVTLATGQLTKRCPFSFLATMNPKNGNYLDPTFPVLSQMPLNPALKTRIDLIFGGFIKTKDKEEVAQILEKQDLIKDIPQEKFNFFKKYLAYCKGQIVEIPLEIRELINGFCSGLIINSDANFRIKDTLNRLVEAFAKINLEERATKENFEDAKNLFLSSLKSTSIKSNELDLSRFVETSTDELNDIKKIESAYNKLKDNNGFCNKKDLFKESNLQNARFTYIIHLMESRNLIDKDKLNNNEDFK